MKRENEKKLTGYSSIDKPWLKYYDKETIEKPLPECTVFQNIYGHNKDFPNDTAILYYGNKISYRTMFDKVELVARALSAIGVGKGSVVNLCTAGVPEAIYLMLAANRLGALANFINPLFTPEQMRARINDTEADWLFVLDEMFSYVEQALTGSCIRHIVILPVNESFPLGLKQAAGLKSKARVILKEKKYDFAEVLSWSDFLKNAKEVSQVRDAGYEKDMPAIMVYSSGSTGASKGIVLTNDGINATIVNYFSPNFPYNRGDTFLQMIPVWFSTGIVLSILMPITLGVTVIPELIFSKETFADDLAKYKPTMTLTATSLWIYAIYSEKLGQIDFSGMKYPITGGEKLLPQDEREINSFLEKSGCSAKLVKGYGMCELGSTISSSVAYNESGKPNSCGYPFSKTIVSAFNPTTNEELRYEEHGELRVISPARMREYYKNPAATSDFFLTDDKGQTWGCTGDIGYVDEDGAVYVLGRATDSAIMDNGETVYMFDVEDVILRETSLSGCKVVAISEDGRTILAAHLTLRDSVTDDAQSIINRIHAACQSALPDYAVPAKYKIRDAFPVHPNGKRDVEILRRETEGFITI